MANKLPYDSYLVRYWYVPICNRLFFCWSILFACAQFISSLFFGANFVFYAYCEESLRYTLLYYAILSRYHCLDYPTYCAFVIQINYSEVFSYSYDTFEFPYFHWIPEMKQTEGQNRTSYNSTLLGSGSEWPKPISRFLKNCQNGTF